MKSKRLLPAREFECKFCEKEFSSERTLARHMCVKKKRWNDRSTIGASLGFRVFQRFNELSLNTKKQKTQMDFISSKYYNDFVGFGRYLVELNPVNAEKFIEYVIMEVRGIKSWSKDATYRTYLKELIEKESMELALRRSVETVQQWSNETGIDFTNFFEDVNVNTATQMISRGKISPWFLYNTPKFSNLLSRMTEDHAKVIGAIVDQDLWVKKLTKNSEDREFASDIMKQAGF